MDRSWMSIKNYLDPKYLDGVDEFIKFAFLGKDPNCKLPCPCKVCNNFEDQTKEVMTNHLCRGIVDSYTRWIFHGEGFESDDENDDIEINDNDSDFDSMEELLNDVGVANFGESWRHSPELDTGACTEKEGEPSRFLRLLSEAEKSLYRAVKTLIPSSYYEAKNFIRELGLKCEKIHACENDCALFWNENKGLDHCPNEKCKAPRYKSPNSKIPRKVLRYFSLKPRLQRLFVNEEIARDMRWHKERRVDNENMMRHPADSLVWKNFDRNHKSFAENPRNVRLGLASDGFNPIGTMSNSYSIWPVILVPYNLLPWKCLKDPFFFLSMIIPGPKAPRNDIDIFFRPLVDELKELFATGVETYDAFREEKFMLRAALLWTINDFPAYGYLSGWSTKEYKACPVCLDETTSLYLNNGHKCCYMGHRRFLPIDHKWRQEKKQFNGEREHRQPPRTLSGEEVLQQLLRIEQVEFGKAPDLLQQKKRKCVQNSSNWKKMSIFFELPYWSTNKIRHNLDIMHIVKNVCESLVGTLMNILSRTKDTWQARKDLKEMGLREELHLQPGGGASKVMPPACYTLSRLEKKNFYQFLSTINFPDGFASNIPRCVKTKECQLLGMKSHDYYVFIQRLLPLATRGMLSKDSFDRICNYFYYYKFREHRQILEKQNLSSVQQRLDSEFPKWFEERVMYTHARGECTDELLSLARGPDFRVNTFAGCNVNGFRFHIKARERERKTQNSGVMVKGEHADKETYFYGIITDIVEVEYSFTQNRVVVFKCDWWDLRNNSGIKVDKQSNITSINMSKTWYSDQPFILASQAEQVFYLQDTKLGGNWHVVELVSPRSSYDVPEKHEDDLVDNEEAYQE
ncbi:uncharacterized protein [Coffea arabica]|uniref:Transposase-associated domain-containing protein n=1 Tax=Coffea arabica TaxID=13443 RepID=A0A6P6WZ57_COFAR|nr:uncharacterized protein LOC113737613 [Coffea arabica]